MGIFDDKNFDDDKPVVTRIGPTSQAQEEQKIDFDSFAASDRSQSHGKEASANEINNSLGNGDKRDVSGEIEEEMKISDEDIKLVEELLFKGWVTKTYKIIGGRHTVEVATVLPCEIDLIDEIISDEIQEIEATGSRISNSMMASRQKMLSLALTYKGMDGRDFGPSTELKFEVIKGGIKKIGAMLSTGEIADLTKIKNTVKSLVKRRTHALSSTHGTIIADQISYFRSKLENMVATVLENDKIIPKS